MPGHHSSRDLLNWYRGKVDPFFREHLNEQKMEEFEKDFTRLNHSLDSSEIELSVCFLGNSGVGKSTLINAVIGGDRPVVPSGGVGPLTAQALVVRYSSHPRFEVEYHGSGQLLRTVFGLEQMFRDQLGKPSTDPDDIDARSELEEIDLVDREEKTESGAPESSSDDTKRLERRERLRRRAQLLVTGKQDDERNLPYLLDCLREAAGGKRCWGTELTEQDASRLRGLSNAILLAKSKTQFSSAADDDKNFAVSLHDHATGYLAPLIKSLTLHWNSPVLQQGIALVDLPGVGVLRDVHREVTRYWIREKANALVVIIDHRGLHESVAEALRQSEFLNALLYSVDEPEDDPVLLVAVTRIDDIANERYQQDKSKKKFQHFLEVSQEARDKLRREMQLALHSIWLNDDEIPEPRRMVVENLLNRLQVHPISAPEYARLRSNDQDDAPFLKLIGQTGIPNFVSSLVDLAVERKRRARERLKSKSSLFRERISTTLELIQQQWESGSRAEHEAKKLKEEMELFMVPLRKEFLLRQGAYRTFLKKNVPQRIRDLVESASLRASVQINRYLTRLGTSHWATLRASVKRGGRYSGASDINLPTEFALRFEEPIAEFWGREILKDIRQETRSYAQDCVRIVEDLSMWALGQGARVQPKLIEAQRDAIRIDAKKLESVGREMIQEMRDEAKARLIDTIEKPIGRRCESFVKKNFHIGPGVKQRILDLYGSMAEEVSEAAKDPAASILQKLFKDVEREILDAFKEHENPLDELAEAIVSSQETYLKHSDAQKRTKTLASLDDILNAMPPAENDQLKVEVSS
jgi:GTP-binding protein EngB required for normal cell division